MHHTSITIIDHLSIGLKKSVFTVDPPQKDKAVVFNDVVSFNKGDTFDYGESRYTVYKVFHRLNNTYSLHATRV